MGELKSGFCWMVGEGRRNLTGYFVGSGWLFSIFLL